MPHPERRTMPYALRHLPNWYALLHKLTVNDDYLEMTRKEFVAFGMTTAGCKANPKALSEVYDDLMKDAGLPPLD